MIRLPGVFVGGGRGFVYRDRAVINRLIGAGVARSWRDPAKRKRRLTAMRRAFDDPLYLALRRHHARSKSP
jgi:hypothetical protein